MSSSTTSMSSPITRARSAGPNSSSGPRSRATRTASNSSTIAARRGRSKRVVVAVPGAEARHPWWNGGHTCYGQICGWAWGDSLCMLKWPGKTFLVCPNWAEFLLAHALVAAAVGRRVARWTLPGALAVAVVGHAVRVPSFYARSPAKPARAVCVAVAATTIISAQELTRVAAALRRLSLFSFSRRFDWFDGTADDQVLDMQLRSLLMFIAYVGVTSGFARFYG